MSWMNFIKNLIRVPKIQCGVDTEHYLAISFTLLVVLSEFHTRKTDYYRNAVFVNEERKLQGV